ncbi:hypothetical protein RHGRI_003689 [Rhododendron griersonianum]|uniref:EF-hand domain-containing protein n=1 Tax=Rhododendron griersonianum TaxID=479676 RepID=A0AAV6L8K0_9ERIC|nr:hypothetical protein RHGRI_003689 [Rhododendron griersonianum]
MEEMRGAAMAYFARMSDDQRQSLEKFKSLIDGNGDGKVSSQEYLDFIRKQGYDHVPSNLFRLLDGNNRGYLDFEECFTLFYMITCNRFVFCGGYNCKSPLLLGLHFVCVECYRVGKGTFSLCSSCYRDTNFDHEHSTFLDNYDLLHTKPWEGNKLSITSGVVGGLDKRATMEDLVKTAKLYYEKSSLDIKAAAWNFFDSLDYNNDGKVSLQEFLGFMRYKGHAKMGSSQFFKELDNDNNGTLEFMEVMALYYIIKSGRPFCGGCDEFIPGMYFTCSVCFDSGNDLFCPSSSVTITEEPTSTTNAVVPYERPKPQWGPLVPTAVEVALNALNLALNAANISCISSVCTIM